MAFVLLTWVVSANKEIRDHEGVPMDNWLTILRAVTGILSAAAATATLINTLVRVRRDGGRKAK
jgi:hypothetical protein